MCSVQCSQQPRRVPFRSLQPVDLNFRLAVGRAAVLVSGRALRAVVLVSLVKSTSLLFFEWCADDYNHSKIYYDFLTRYCVFTGDKFICVY